MQPLSTASLSDVAARALSLAESSLADPGDEGFHAVRKALGVSAGSEAICNFCAVPFAHGQALAPEIRRLEAAFDRNPDKTRLHQAHERLRHLDLEMPSASAALAGITEPMLPASLGTSARVAVEARLAREPEHVAARERELEAVRARADAGRPAFLESLESVREVT